MKLLNIEAEREKHKMSKKYVAEYLGVTLEAMEAWQQGTSEIPISKLYILCRLWSCSADYLLGLDDKRQSND